MSIKDIAPTVRLEQTINNPLDKAEVLGFTGRNTKLGMHAVAIKGDACPTDETLDCDPIVIPQEYGERIINDGWQLIALDDDTVYQMHAADFDRDSSLHTFKHPARGYDDVTMFIVRRADMISHPASQVTVTN